MECTQKSNKKNCTCTYDCERRGKCCDCVAFHRDNGELPGCFFSPADEAVYDRSIAFFMRCRSRVN